jgi:signal transduction histidine kinase
MQDNDSGLAQYAATRLGIARLRVQGVTALHSVAARACSEAARALNVRRVGLWLLDKDGTTLHVFCQHDLNGDVAFGGTVIRRADFPEYFAALETRGLIRADDVRQDPATASLAEAYFLPAGIGATLDAPVLVDGIVVGVVCHEHAGAARAFADAECVLAMGHADALGAKIAESRHAETEQRLEQTAAELAAELAEMRSREVTGRFAAGLAHDLANIIQIVRGNAELIVQLGEASVHPMAKDIIEAAQKAKDLTADLMALGRREAAPKLVPVRSHLSNVAATLSRALAPTVLHLNGSGQGQVLIDPAQLERVFTNLVLNARDARPEGPIAITIEDTQLGATTLELPPGRYVLVRVEDRGPGMDETTRIRIFEPYFTTKPSGHGLGLAVVADLVQRAGGFIRVTSAPGEGTAMRVYLPRFA